MKKLETLVNLLERIAPLHKEILLIMLGTAVCAALLFDKFSALIVG